jgi:hypothetical protein
MDKKGQLSSASSSSRRVVFLGSLGGAKEMNIVLSLFVQRKNERKACPTSEAGWSAGNTNLGLFVRPLHLALMAPPKSPWFALFPVFPSRPLKLICYKQF